MLDNVLKLCWVFLDSGVKIVYWSIYKLWQNNYLCLLDGGRVNKVIIWMEMCLWFVSARLAGGGRRSSGSVGRVDEQL